MSPRPLATIAEVAEYLRLSDKTLRNWAKRGKGPVPRMVAGEYRYRWDEVEAYVESLAVGSDEVPEPCGCTGI